MKYVIKKLHTLCMRGDWRRKGIKGLIREKIEEKKKKYLRYYFVSSIFKKKFEFRYKFFKIQWSKVISDSEKAEVFHSYI